MWQDLQAGDPRLIGPYRLRGVLGAGGMGRVFLGASADDRLVAVKVIRSDLATDPEFRARFRREIEVARKVSGPFTAPVIDAGTDGPVAWLATEYVTGLSLAHTVAEHGPLPPGPVLELAAGLAQGLNAIHSADVVHLDLKPSNVLLGPDGPRLIDFGISGASGATALTGPGLMIGSPGYMSPEQAEGCSAGPASDVFSLGAVLTFAVTGEGPFGPGSSVALIYRVIHRPPDLTRVPGEVRGLIERCLIKDPALRPTARDLLAATRTVRLVTPRPSEPVTGRIIPPPPLTTAPEAVTTPLPVRVPLDQLLMAPDLPPSMLTAGPASRRPERERPAQRESRSSWQRLRSPLAVATLVVALVGAAAMAGLALTGAQPGVPAVQSGQSAAATRTPAPTASAPSSAHPRSTAAVPRTRSAAPAASPPTSSAPLSGGSSPAGTTSPASTGTPVTSSPGPSGSPAPTGWPDPSAAPSPSPSAPPTSASGGYGY